MTKLATKHIGIQQFIMALRTQLNIDFMTKFAISSESSSCRFATENTVIVKVFTVLLRGNVQSEMCNI